jgi:hypothetical protein
VAGRHALASTFNPYIFLVNIAVRDLRAARKLMQMMSLVIFTVIGMALFAGLSLKFYRALPPQVVECGARHGRYADLGAHGQTNQRPAGDTSATDYEALQGQSV